jgi:nicotinate-nucleotide adenylyltransferase
LPQWRDWESFTNYAHIVVAHRPGWSAPDHGVLGEFLRERATTFVQSLHDEPAGRVYVAEVTQLEISSTALRESIAQGVDPKFLVPPAVRSIILEAADYAGTAVSEQ